MIELFFNDTGYYIRGNEIEAVQSCSPAPCFQPIHHRYGVCYHALAELKNSTDDVVVYNDSRIIDELNGKVDPYDGTCQRWLTAIHRSMLPSLRACVIFRKKPAEFVNSKISAAQTQLLNKAQPEDRKRITDAHEQAVQTRTNRLVQDFKDRTLNYSERFERQS